MNRFYLLCFLAMVLCSCTGGDNSVMQEHRLQSALTSLGVQKGNPNLCVLTNAPYVKTDTHQSKTYLDAISEQTGCSEKKGNLLFFHRSPKTPLLTAVFHRKTGDCVVMHPASSAEKPLKFQINRNTIATEDFWVKARGELNHSDAYSMVSILGSWWLDAPRDFLKSAERHGHVCPGLVFGYFMAKTIQKDYPLRPGEEYIFVANNPTFCGNDAFRVILEVTEEKENLFLKEFSKNEKDRWTIHDGSGVLVKWHEQKNRGQGIVLGMDMAKLRQRTGFEKPSKDPEAMVPAVLRLIPYLNRFPAFVTLLWESPVDDKMLAQLKTSEGNPYVIVGWK